MCFETVGVVAALPADQPGTAVLDVAGTRRQVSLVVLAVEGIEVAVGDWLRTHTGLAIAKLPPAEAARLVAEQDVLRVATDRSGSAAVRPGEVGHGAAASDVVASGWAPDDLTARAAAGVGPATGEPGATP